MNIEKNGENKHLKYNHVAPIDLDTIPLEEREQALKEFAEGSIGLENCLRTMWENGLKTHACCAGEEDEYDVAYISMAEEVDVFSYLSEELLTTDMIALEFDYGRQTIRFVGTSEIKEQLMQRLAEDITSGKKDNTDTVKEKIGKDLDEEWMRERRIHFMRKAGMSEEEIIESELHRKEFNRILESGTYEEVYAAALTANERLLASSKARAKK